MISGLSVLAVIPARGGSKGVPRKNVRTVGGKPLIAWTIEAGSNSRYIDHLILSSEDDEIIKIAKQYGCDVPFIRPSELARDETPGIEPVIHALEILNGYDLIVLLQPTSPLRISEDIDGCIQACVEQASPSCVTVTESEKSPYWMYQIESSDNKLVPIIQSSQLHLRRQDTPKTFQLNGAVYVARSNWLLKHKTFLSADTIGYIMPKERSLDIDTELDIKIMEILVKENRDAKT